MFPVLDVLKHSKEHIFRGQKIFCTRRWDGGGGHYFFAPFSFGFSAEFFYVPGLGCAQTVKRTHFPGAKKCCTWGVERGVGGRWCERLALELKPTDVHYRGLRRLGGSAPQTPLWRVFARQFIVPPCDMCYLSVVLYLSVCDYGARPTDVRYRGLRRLGGSAPHTPLWHVPGLGAKSLRVRGCGMSVPAPSRKAGPEH